MHLLHLDYIPPVICHQKNTTASGRAQPVLEGIAWTLFLRAGQQNPSATALSSLCWPEKNKTSVIAWRISPYTFAVARASPTKWYVAGCWDFVKQNHLLLLK